MKKKKGASDIGLGCIMAFGILFIFASVCMFVGSVALGTWGWLHG